MTGDEATALVIDALEALAIPYMIAGSFSSNVYGIPRSTQDADFVIQCGDGGLADLARRLGPEFRLDPQASFETVTMTTRYVMELPEIPFAIEFFRVSDDPHDQERFRRRQRAQILGRSVFLPTAEDVVVTKLRWAVEGRRAKDREDARNVMAVQGNTLDWTYIALWCDRHSTRELLEEIRKTIPPD